MAKASKQTFPSPPANDLVYSSQRDAIFFGQFRSMRSLFGQSMDFLHFFRSEFIAIPTFAEWTSSVLASVEVVIKGIAPSQILDSIVFRVSVLVQTMWFGRRRQPLERHANQSMHQVRSTGTRQGSSVIRPQIDSQIAVCRSLRAKDMSLPSNPSQVRRRVSALKSWNRSPLFSKMFVSHDCLRVRRSWLEPSRGPFPTLGSLIVPQIHKAGSPMNTEAIRDLLLC